MPYQVSYMCDSVTLCRLPKFGVTTFRVRIGAKNLPVNCTISSVGTIQPPAIALALSSHSFNLLSYFSKTSLFVNPHQRQLFEVTQACGKLPCQFVQWQEELETIVSIMHPEASNVTKRFHMYRHMSRKLHGPLAKGERKRLPECFENGLR
jgi:hypothetical protein